MIIFKITNLRNCGEIHKTSYDNLKIIFKEEVPINNLKLIIRSPEDSHNETPLPNY
jgi:hypothetical protein